MPHDLDATRLTLHVRLGEARLNLANLAVGYNITENLTKYYHPLETSSHQDFRA